MRLVQMSERVRRYWVELGFGGGRRPNYFVPVGNTCGRYQQFDDNRFPFATSLLGGAALNPAFSNPRPHTVSFITANNLQIAVQADQQASAPASGRVADGQPPIPAPRTTASVQTRAVERRWR